MENQRQWFYMPPEITEILLKKKERPDLKTNFSDSLSTTPWSFDIYSLGVVLLELAMGFPIWVAQKVEMLHFNQKVPLTFKHGIMHM